jgi:hypothetical protein
MASMMKLIGMFSGLDAAARVSSAVVTSCVGGDCTLISGVAVTDDAAVTLATATIAALATRLADLPAA